MSFAKLIGAFPLTAAAIDAAVTQTSAGAFILGNDGPNGTFRTAFVDRAKLDVRAALKLWIGAYPKFMFRYCASPREAFESACDLYHALNPSGSYVHPLRPKDAAWTCPCCEAFD